MRGTANRLRNTEISCLRSKYPEVKQMKKYISPEIEINNLKVSDIITTSEGTETPKVEDTDGVWDLDL